MIYSTCSLENEENEMVIEEFLKKDNEFAIIRNEVYESFSNEKGYARTFPHRNQIDGFFIVTLKKC